MVIGIVVVELDELELDELELDELELELELVPVVELSVVDVDVDIGSEVAGSLVIGGSEVAGLLVVIGDEVDVESTPLLPLVGSIGLVDDESESTPLEPSLDPALWVPGIVGAVCVLGYVA